MRRLRRRQTRRRKRVGMRSRHRPEVSALLLQHVSVNSNPSLSDSAGDHASHRKQNIWLQ